MKFNVRQLCSFFEKSILPLTALFFVFTTVIGAIRNYSPVPFWDMWDGYIGFYEQVSKGHPEIWWAPHNEHRILFSRLFFWLDIRFFHGLSLLLIPLNLALMALLWLALVSGTRRLFKSNPDKSFLVAAASWLALICFSWMQKENIIVAFQSSFFAAFLFPLLAFQCMAFSIWSSRSKLWFGLALLFGLVSVGTLANGLFALPLLVVMAIVLRQSKVRIIVVTLVTLMSIVVSYGATGANGSPVNNIRLHPVEALQFLLIYLGGPFRVISGDYVVAGIAGAIFVTGLVHCVSLWFQDEKRSPMFLAFVIFLLYVGGTALATTSGRVIFGVEGSNPGRYTTPMLLGWAVLSILIGYRYREHVNYPGAALVISTLFPLLLLPSQLESIRGDPSLLKHQHMIAALALDLGVNDKEAIRTIYPDDRIFVPANEANRRHLSVFGLPAFKNARQYLRQQSETLPLHICRSHIDTVVPVNGAEGVSRVAGWAFDEDAKQVPDEIFIVDSHDKVVGVGLTGFPRTDVARVIDRKAGLSGFDGYLFGDTNNDLRLMYVGEKIHHGDTEATK